jgi:hypothetical protein
MYAAKSRLSHVVLGFQVKFFVLMILVCPAYTTTVQDAEATTTAQALTSAGSTTTDEVFSTTVAESSSNAETTTTEVFFSKTPAIKTTKAEPTTTEEIFSKTAAISSSNAETATTEDVPKISTTDEESAMLEEVITTTEDVVSTTTAQSTSIGQLPSAGDVEPAATFVSTMPEEVVPTTTAGSTPTMQAALTAPQYSVTNELIEVFPTSTSGSRTADEVFPKTTAESTATTERLSETTDSVKSDEVVSTTADSSPTPEVALQSNVPGVTLESISELILDIPVGCFESIGDLCQSNAENVTSCSNSVVSDLLVEQALNVASILLGIPLRSKNDDFSTSVTHDSTCEGNQETDWIETYEITSTDSREPNTTYEVTSVLLTQTFTAMSFLQVGINSFGTSSVQRACYFVNGDAVVEFSGVPGGIIGGYTVSEDIYDCSYYVSVLVVSYEEGNTTAPSFILMESTYPDFPENVGLALEYSIVCIYILVAVYGAYRSYRVHQSQRTRSDYKTNVNIGFIALFTAWAIGNLLYMLLYSLALTESNFFYIKQVLTLSYFVVYFGFVLIIQYR